MSTTNSRPSPRSRNGPRVTRPTIVQAIGGVTSTFLPKSLTRCGLTHSRSRRLIVHKVRGTARSSACLSVAVLAPIGTAISDICVGDGRSEEHTSELQSLMRISYAVLCLKKKKNTKQVIQ